MPKSFFNKIAGLKPATLLEKRLWHRCFPVSFVKFLRMPFYRTPLDDCFWTYVFLSLFSEKSSIIMFDMVLKMSFSLLYQVLTLYFIWKSITKIFNKFCSNLSTVGKKSVSYVDINLYTHHRTSKSFIHCFLYYIFYLFVL